MKDKDIIKALECCLHSGERCNKCELNGFHDCIALHPKDILDLINRLKRESNSYRNKAQTQKGELARLNKQVAELQAEIEYLKKVIETMTNEQILSATEAKDEIRLLIETVENQRLQLRELKLKGGAE